MFKRSMFILVLFTLLITCQTVFGDFGWWDSTGDHRWENPENWSLKEVPSLLVDDGDIIINNKAIYPDVGVYINSGVTAVANIIQFSTRADETATLNVAGGTLTTSGQLRLGVNADGTGIINLNSGLIDNSDSSTLVGFKGAGTLNINGGTFNTSWLTVCQNSGTTGHVQLDGGVLYASTLALNYDRGAATFDIRGGTLILGGNKISTVQDWFDLDYFTSYGGTGILDMSYDEVENKTIITAVVPEPATVVLLALGSLVLRNRRQ